MNKADFAIYLYDADGTDRELELEEVDLNNLKDHQLLWADVLQRDEKLIGDLFSILGLTNVSVRSMMNVSERPKIEIFETFYRLFIVSVGITDNKQFQRIPIDFIVGKNFVLTVQDGEVDYFKEFRKRQMGETQIGELDAESFVATLLDLHIVSYFRVLEKIVAKVDELDEKVLKSEFEDSQFLTEMVQLRKGVSSLRRWFFPHRDVFYALSRPEFQRIAESDSAEDFKMLNNHFESAIDAMESVRDTVLSVFELYATKSAQTMNDLIRKLTFFTLIVGSMGVIAGIFGMNYQLSYFETEQGFWITVGGMGVIAFSLTILAKFMRWL